LKAFIYTADLNAFIDDNLIFHFIVCFLCLETIVLTNHPS
jgi:hypothetical protein